MRNPLNTNQTLYYLPAYKGFPVQVSHGPLVEEYLQQLFVVFRDCVFSHRRGFVLRVDLRYSQNHALPHDINTNAPLQRFLASLQAKLDHKDRQRYQQTGRVNAHGMRYVWAREIGVSSGIPHYHLALFFNGDAYRSHGNYNDLHAPALCNRIRAAWASALRLPIEVAARLVSFPPNGSWRIERKAETCFAAFKACSYLCKAATKPFGQGAHCFGSSQNHVPVGRTFE
ncbi:inovirus Gp2 family protein [Halopseudomonas aestusnigri]|uniref:inovirus Gp2 family protein n=1 Tax=Halopseudomonas aestusnigri TaxID=857252 RepID=UPI002554E29A|nr:inovirus Gp2 family protein [Halopseudomonas aestusnigri]MDL2198154.1 inovirus Gp2 family protein [Halopseudomonas aestusnigri]